MCRVKDCPQKHNQHYCRSCKDQDSSHFAAECPFLQQINNNMLKSTFDNTTCRVKTCPQNHQTHYCRVCQNGDSSHFANDCPTLEDTNAHNPNPFTNQKRRGNTCSKNNSQFYNNIFQNQDRLGFKRRNPDKNWMVASQLNNFRSNGCKVNGCPERHHQHYCRNCQDNNSQHYAEDCPKQKIVNYYRIGKAQSLTEDKDSKSNNPNMSSRRGGKHFIDNPNVAWQIAKSKVLEYRNKQSVISKVKNINVQAQDSNQQNGTRAFIRRSKISK